MSEGSCLFVLFCCFAIFLRCFILLFKIKRDKFVLNKNHLVVSKEYISIRSNLLYGCFNLYCNVCVCVINHAQRVTL